MLRAKLIGAALLIAALSPAMAEERWCELTLFNANNCTVLNYKKPMPEPYQWLKPYSRPAPGDHYSEYIQQTAAMQFVGVMTDLQFINRHCPNIVPNYPLIGAMMITLGIRQQDIDSGKYAEEIAEKREPYERDFNLHMSFTSPPVTVAEWCKIQEEKWFTEDGDYHGLATIK